MDKKVSLADWIVNHDVSLTFKKDDYFHYGGITIEMRKRDLLSKCCIPWEVIHTAEETEVMLHCVLEDMYKKGFEE